MIDFLQNLKARNEILFCFGFICLVFSMVFLVLTKFTNTQIYNVNAWYKPFKFAFSIGIFAWTMGWYGYYLPATFHTKLFSWTTVILLGFEVIYIAIQAGRGQLSHYNISTPVYSALYSMMGLAASLATLYTAYIGLLFFTNEFPTLPAYYLWAIRLGIIIFVVFSFEGALMGGRLSHTIGGPDGGIGIPLLHWSTKFGDPRIPHFIGMHALQVLPLVSFYILKNTKATILLSLLYGLLAIFTLILALQGKPLFKSKAQEKRETIYQ